MTHGDEYVSPQEIPQPVDNVTEERYLRLLVTGSRDWNNYGCIAQALKDIWLANGSKPMLLISGACPTGADRMAEHVWEAGGMLVERHPAEWDRFGRRAGFIRNRAMVDLGADLCVAFIRNKSKGATHTVDLAREAGIPVIEYSVIDLDYKPSGGAHARPGPVD